MNTRDSVPNIFNQTDLIMSTSRSTTMPDSSKTSEVFKRVKRTRTKQNHFPGQTTLSVSRRISSLDSPTDLQVSRMSEEGSGSLVVRSTDQVENGHEVISFDNLDSEQGSSSLTTKASRSGARKTKKKKVSNKPSRSTPKLSPEKKKSPNSSSIPTNKLQAGSRKISTNSDSDLKVSKYKCQWCPARFKTEKELTGHLRIHSKEKPFRCSFCSKKSSTSYYAKVQERVHVGKKKFNCKFCSKKFFWSSELKRHERVHTGERPYSCKFCLKSFSVSCNLVTHMRTHTREKPFQCTSCSKEFAQQSNLTAHKKSHHPNEYEEQK